MTYRFSYFYCGVIGINLQLLDSESVLFVFEKLGVIAFSERNAVFAAEIGLLLVRYHFLSPVLFTY